MKKLLVLTVVCLNLILLTAPAHAFTVTSPFGWRVHPITQQSTFHNGIDIAADYGDGIPAVFSGQVVYAGWYDGFGNTVILYHGDTLYTLYGHCSQLLVNVGDSVEAGQVIAAVGSTGISTGPHVHLSVWKEGQYIDPMTLWQ